MSILWLVLASLIWTGLVAATAEWIAGATVRPHFAQGVWRGAAILMALPWLAAGIAAIWPVGADTPLPTVEALPAAAGAAMLAMGEADTALATQAGPWLSQAVVYTLLAGWAVRAVMITRGQWRLQSIKHDAKASDGRGDSAHWAGLLGLTQVPDVRTIESGSPFVAGLAKRAVYLPEAIKDDDTRRLVIAHECVHLSRGDLMARPFERAIADLLWFSPFAWIARARLDYLREAVCDAETVSLTGERQRYARALTQVARAARPVQMLPVSGFIPRRKGALPKRVRGIVEADVPRANRAAAFVAGLVGLVAAPLAIAQGIALEAEASKTWFSHAVVVHPDARISSKFGYRQFADEPKMHKGVDVAAPKGTPVCAPASGEVVGVTAKSAHDGYGNQVSIYLDDGRKMRFASLDEMMVEEGQRVNAGDTIGTVGKSAKDATGPHVHVEVWKKVHGDDGYNYIAQDAAEIGVVLYEN